MSTSTHPPRTEQPGGATPPPPPTEDRVPEKIPGAQPGPTARPIGWGLALIGAGVLWLGSTHVTTVFCDLDVPEEWRVTASGPSSSVT